MQRPVSSTKLQDPGSFCINNNNNNNNNRRVLNKFSADCRPVSGLGDFQALSFQMQNVFKIWYITINYSWWTWNVSGEDLQGHRTQFIGVADTETEIRIAYLPNIVGHSTSSFLRCRLFKALVEWDYKTPLCKKNPNKTMKPSYNLASNLFKTLSFIFLIRADIPASFHQLW
jgi:hypothetical protein